MLASSWRMAEMMVAAIYAAISTIALRRADATAAPSAMMADPA
jgi:hypothetical protein